MRRRSWGAAVTMALLLGSFASGSAQTPARVPRIGLLSIGTDPGRPLPQQWIAFLDGLRQQGYVDGQNIVVERRFAGAKPERVADLATGLVQQKVDVIVVTGTREVVAARRATSTIPIVTIVAPDLVADGLVASLARPGGNITGLTFSTSGVGGKYVEFLREAVPAAAPNDGVTNPNRRQVVDLAAKYRVPAIYPVREFVEAGGLMAHGPSFADLFRRAATFVDKILKGARPGDLPMEQPTKFELAINARTARTLGLTIPQSLLARAEAVGQ